MAPQPDPFGSAPLQVAQACRACRTSEVSQEGWASVSLPDAWRPIDQHPRVQAGNWLSAGPGGVRYCEECGGLWWVVYHAKSGTFLSLESLPDDALMAVRADASIDEVEPLLQHGRDAVADLALAYFQDAEYDPEAALNLLGGSAGLADARYSRRLLTAIRLVLCGRNPRIPRADAEGRLRPLIWRDPRWFLRAAQEGFGSGLPRRALVEELLEDVLRAAFGTRFGQACDAVQASDEAVASLLRLLRPEHRFAVAVRSVEDAADGVLASAPAPHGPEWRSGYAPARLEGELHLLGHALSEMEALLADLRSAPDSSDEVVVGRLEKAREALHKAGASLGPLCRAHPDGGRRAEELKARCDALLAQVRPPEAAPAAAATAAALAATAPLPGGSDALQLPRRNPLPPRVAGARPSSFPRHFGESLSRALRLYFGGLALHAPAVALTWLLVEGAVPACCGRAWPAQIAAVLVGWVFYAGGAALASGRWAEGWAAYFFRRPGAFLDALPLALGLGLPALVFLGDGGGEDFAGFAYGAAGPAAAWMAAVWAALFWMSFWSLTVSFGLRSPSSEKRRSGEAPWLPSVLTAWRLARAPGAWWREALPLAATALALSAAWTWARLDVTRTPTEIWMWDASLYGFLLPFLACAAFACGEAAEGRSPSASRQVPTRQSES